MSTKPVKGLSPSDITRRAMGKPSQSSRFARQDDQMKDLTFEECRRQNRVVAQADAMDVKLQKMMDQALEDVDGWEE